MSKALFDIDPYSFLNQNNETERENNKNSGAEETSESVSARSAQHLEKVDNEDYYFFDYDDDNRNNGSLKNRQLVNIMGLRPRLRVEIRMLKIKLFEIFHKTSFNMFLGIGTADFLDDILHFNERSREDSLLSSLEDFVSLIGVDGPACVHRMFCEIGAAPIFQTNGLFGELVDLTIRHILTSVYADVSSNSVDDYNYSSVREDGAGQQDESSSLYALHVGSRINNSSHSSSSSRSSNGNSNGFHSFPEDEGREAQSPVSYLDAVSAGRHGANCAHVFDKCPISLLEITNFIRDDNM